jgi:hypothetical protein
MKTIKIKFVDFWEGFEPLDSIFYKTLIKKYNVEISDEPQYIFFSVFGFSHYKYEAIRIFYTGEQYSPDFDIADYAIGFDDIQFSDRYLRYPLYLLKHSKSELNNLINRKQNDDLSKKDFCSFVYSNEFALTNRDEFFNQLSRYKKVNSGGRHLNNIGYRVQNKEEFLSKHKFTIAFENTSYPGYTTEKILDGFLANTIPIYFGNPEIGKEFNERSFINIHSYNSFESAIKRVIEIDTNDDEYNKILNTKKIHEDSIMPSLEDLESFLFHIFDQDFTHAGRRPLSIRALKKVRVLKLYALLNKIYYLLPKFVRGKIQKKTYRS